MQSQAGPRTFISDSVGRGYGLIWMCNAKAASPAPPQPMGTKCLLPQMRETGAGSGPQRPRMDVLCQNTHAARQLALSFSWYYQCV